MKILVSGCDGFVGHHLKRELEAHGHSVVGLSLAERTGYVQCDITDLSRVSEVFSEHQPEYFIHLAGIAKTNINPADIAELGRINVVGTFNVCKALSESAKKSVMVFVSSGLVYGDSSGKASFSEQDPVNPPHVYGQSKLAAENVVKMFGYCDNLKTYIVRPFNHIGPFQSEDFVVPALARRIKMTSAGGSIQVGDLSTYRDFVDVRDIVRAYRLILEKQPEEKLFVLGSGKSLKIESMLNELIKISKKDVTVQVNKDLLRKNDPVQICGDAGLIKKALGWEPQISIQQSLLDVYSSLS